jgi:hypothetical protein
MGLSQARNSSANACNGRMTNPYRSGDNGRTYCSIESERSDTFRAAFSFPIRFLLPARKLNLRLFPAHFFPALLTVAAQQAALRFRAVTAFDGADVYP